MSKDKNEKEIIENEQIKKLRKGVEKLLSEPEFKEMSEALRQSLAQRLGPNELSKSELVLEAALPETTKEKELPKAKAVSRRPYFNIYRYRFW